MIDSTFKYVLYLFGMFGYRDYGVRDRYQLISPFLSSFCVYISVLATLWVMTRCFYIRSDSTLGIFLHFFAPILTLSPLLRLSLPLQSPTSVDFKNSNNGHNAFSPARSVSFSKIGYSSSIVSPTGSHDGLVVWFQ